MAIERPKKQKRFYSGKKKRHSLKAQVVIDVKTKEVLCTDFSRGKVHDFKLFKASRIVFHKATKVFSDSGYQGLERYHKKSYLSKK